MEVVNLKQGKFSLEKLGDGYALTGGALYYVSGSSSFQNGLQFCCGFWQYIDGDIQAILEVDEQRGLYRFRTLNNEYRLKFTD